MLLRMRPSTLLPFFLAISCETKWTDVRAPYARFEIREVADLAKPFTSYIHAGSDQPAAEGACGGVEFRTEEVPPRSGLRVVYAWAANRNAVEQCVNGLATSAVNIAISKAGSAFRTYNLGPTILSGADVVRGRLDGKDEMLFLQLEVTPAATRRMFDFTSSHIGRRMAIVLDGDVESAPVIVGPINSSRVSLSVTEKSAGLALLRRLTGT